jgi:hypothetical protein
MGLSYSATLACILATVVGCALARVLMQVLQLGIGGVAFLAQSHARCGDAFTIGALPPRLVFLRDPAAVRHFFTAHVEEVDFRAAVEHFTQRVFQVSLHEKGVLVMQQNVPHTVCYVVLFGIVIATCMMAC